MKNKWLTLLLTGVILLSGSDMAVAFEVVEPSESFYVADYANVLSADLEQNLVECSTDLQQQCGAQLVVVTVDFLGGAD
ncbi:MAG: TPM domain-containing protein, partial [Clostridiales bacterium]